MLDMLPWEMVEYIISFLPLSSIGNMCLVNKRIREIILSSKNHLFRHIMLDQVMDLVHKHGHIFLASKLVTLPQIDPNKTM